MTRTTDRPERTHLSGAETEALALTQTELLSELWILRDRVLVLEHILKESGVLTEDIDQYAPPEELTKRLDRDRDNLVARVAGAGHRKRIAVDELKAEAQREVG